MAVSRGTTAMSVSRRRLAAPLAIDCASWASSVRAYQVGPAPERATSGAPAACRAAGTAARSGKAASNGRANALARVSAAGMPAADQSATTSSGGRAEICRGQHAVEGRRLTRDLDPRGRQHAPEAGARREPRQALAAAGGECGRAIEEKRYVGAERAGDGREVEATCGDRKGGARESQRGGRIAACATEPGRCGDPLVQDDVEGGGMIGSRDPCVQCTEDEVLLARQVRYVDVQVRGASRRGDQIVEKPDGMHRRDDLVVPVSPLAGDGETEIDLGGGRKTKGHAGNSGSDFSSRTHSSSVSVSARRIGSMPAASSHSTVGGFSRPRP